MTVKCPLGKFLNITDANYGRLAWNRCSTQGQVTNCSSALSLFFVRTTCHGLNSCKIKASNSVFGDPCVKTVKYLEMKYTCLGGNLRQIFSMHQLALH